MAPRRAQYDQLDPGSEIGSSRPTAQPRLHTLALLLVALSVGANTLLLTWLSAVVLNPCRACATCTSSCTSPDECGERAGLSLVPADSPVLQKNSRSLTRLDRPRARGSGVRSGSRRRRARAAHGRHRLGQLLPGARRDTPRSAARCCSADDRPEAAPVAVLSDALWRRRFNADPAVVGRVIQINRQPFTVVGVAPAAFRRHLRRLAAGLLDAGLGDVPVSPGERVFVQIMGRRAPGATLDTVRAELPVLAARLREDDPRANKGLDLIGLVACSTARAACSRGWCPWSPCSASPRRCSSCSPGPISPTCCSRAVSPGGAISRCAGRSAPGASTCCAGRRARAC